jgi:hypothetical protein
MNKYPTARVLQKSWLAFLLLARHEMAPVKQLLLPIILLATAYCQAAPILPEEARNHIGESVSVRGLVQ